MEVTVTAGAPAKVCCGWRGPLNLPPVEMLSGQIDVFHGTNFVLPPSRRAAGVVTVHDLGFVLHPETVDRTSMAYLKLVPRALERHPARSSSRRHMQPLTISSRCTEPIATASS